MRDKNIEEMMEYIAKMYGRGEETSRIEEILDSHNASEDDSGEEGYFSTMSDEDIEAAYEEVKELFENKEWENLCKFFLDNGFSKKEFYTTDGGTVTAFLKDGMYLFAGLDENEARAIARLF